MDDMIIENKIRSTPPTQKRGPLVRVSELGGILFIAFFYKHVTTFRVINFIE